MIGTICQRGPIAARLKAIADERITVMHRYVDGAILKLGTRAPLAVAALDEQPCENEVVYAGYTRGDWEAGADPTYYVIQTAQGWYVTLRYDRAAGVENAPCFCDAHPDNRAATEELETGDAYTDWS